MTLATVNLTLAAAMVVAHRDVGGTVARAALDVWAVLTGLDDADALAYAEALVADTAHTVTATVAPF